MPATSIILHNVDLSPEWLRICRTAVRRWLLKSVSRPLSALFSMWGRASALDHTATCTKHWSISKETSLPRSSARRYSTSCRCGTAAMASSRFTASRTSFLWRHTRARPAWWMPSVWRCWPIRSEGIIMGWPQPGLLRGSVSSGFTCCTEPCRSSWLRERDSSDRLISGDDVTRLENTEN